jgi:SAM-dependent methyltransferase
MQIRLLDLIACPDCGSGVRLVGGDAGPLIARGRLECSGCGRAFDIRNGIPRLLPRELEASAGEQDSAAHFAAEFSAEATDDADMDPPELLEYYFYSRTGLDQGVFEVFGTSDVYRTSLPAGVTYVPDTKALRGRVVLDAGCGPGRLIPVAAGAAEYVVGLDFGSHIERAAYRCRHLDNVDFVQGSVLSPPFRKETFDSVYSLGVLHHTPDPRSACLRLSTLLREGGAFAVWVYPPEYWGGPVREPVARGFHRWFSRLRPETKEMVARRALMPLGRLQALLARRLWTKLLGAPLFLLSVPRHPLEKVMLVTILDYYGPPFISTHTYDEVRSWLTQAGFQSLHRVPVPTAWLATDRHAPPSLAETER